MSPVQYSQHLQLDTLLYKLHNYLETELKATILSLHGVHLTIGNRGVMNPPPDLIPEKDFGLF